MKIPPGIPRSRSFTRFTMRVALPHLGQSVLLVVSMTFLRSAVFAIFIAINYSPYLTSESLAFAAFCLPISSQLPIATKKSIVVLQPEMGDEVFALQVPQRVLEFHQLNEQIMLGIKPGRGHGGLEVEAQPLLNSQAAQFRATLCQIEEQDQIQHDRRSQNRVTAEKIHLNLHGIAQPSEDIDIVPTLFVVTTRRVIVN